MSSSCSVCSSSYRVVTITTDPPKGPYSLGATVKLQCRVTPPPPERAIYFWSDSIPSTTSSSTQPNLTLTIPAHHPSHGYYYCTVSKGSSVLSREYHHYCEKWVGQNLESYLLIVLWARVAGKIKANDLQQLTICLHVNVGSFHVKSTHTHTHKKNHDPPNFKVRASQNQFVAKF